MEAARYHTRNIGKLMFIKHFWSINTLYQIGTDKSCEWIQRYTLLETYEIGKKKGEEMTLFNIKPLAELS